MLKYLAPSMLAIALGALPTVAGAQDCTVGAYWDPAGTVSEIHLQEFGQYQFSVFVVMFAEDLTNAVAYKLDFANLNGTVFLQNRIAGPSGSGLILDADPASIGTNVALGECAVGYGGLPILVEEYVFLGIGEVWGVIATISANTNQNPLYPEYASCTHVQKDCLPGPNLIGLITVPTTARSFGAIKSLY